MLIGLLFRFARPLEMSRDLLAKVLKEPRALVALDLGGCELRRILRGGCRRAVR